MKLENTPRQYLRCTCLYAASVMLCCTLSEALAADWAPVTKAKDRETLVDMDSYNEADGLPYITTKTVFLNPKNYHKDMLEFSYSERHTTTQFNCTLHTFKNNSTQFYNANNKLVGSEKSDHSFKPIPAGSKYAALKSLVCQVQRMVAGH